MDIDYAALRVPTAEQVREGFTVNREYSDVSYLTWVDAERVADVEVEILSEVAARARSPEEFEDAASEAEYDEYGAEDLEWLELGVAGVVAALVAAGCATTFSCRGHARRPSHPQVRSAADADRARLLAEAAQASNCGLFDDEERLLWVVADTIAGMIGFADEVRARADQFDALPPPAWKLEPPIEDDTCW